MCEVHHPRNTSLHINTHRHLSSKKHWTCGQVTVHILACHYTAMMPSPQGSRCHPPRKLLSPPREVAVTPHPPGKLMSTPPGKSLSQGSSYSSNPTVLRCVLYQSQHAQSCSNGNTSTNSTLYCEMAGWVKGEEEGPGRGGGVCM